MRELSVTEVGFVSGGQSSGSRAGGWRVAAIFMVEWAIGKVVDKAADLMQSAAEPNGAPVEPLPGPYDHWATKPGG
jgi:hypothetical protein